MRANWKAAAGGKGEFESAWRKALHDGFIDGTAFAAKTAQSGATARILQARSRRSEDAIEVIFRADPSIYDGRYSNIGWLQELPKPM